MLNLGIDLQFQILTYYTKKKHLSIHQKLYFGVDFFLKKSTTLVV